MQPPAESVSDYDPEYKVSWLVYFWFVMLMACIESANWFVHRFELPGWLRMVVVLVPIVPFAVLAKEHWRAVTRGDELSRHMARETYVVAFYVLLGVFMCVSTLKGAGFLAGFVWEGRWPVYAMILSLGVGDICSRWRYR
jgi:hypothetical protein